jgi:hypothetical protein
MSKLLSKLLNKLFDSLDIVVPLLVLLLVVCISAAFFELRADRLRKIDLENRIKALEEEVRNE